MVQEDGGRSGQCGRRGLRKTQRLFQETNRPKRRLGKWPALRAERSPGGAAAPCCPGSRFYPQWRAERALFSLRSWHDGAEEKMEMPLERMLQYSCQLINIKQ